jgi:hypothetical protein
VFGFRHNEVVSGFEAELGCVWVRHNEVVFGLKQNEVVCGFKLE